MKFKEEGALHDAEYAFATARVTGIRKSMAGMALLQVNVQCLDVIDMCWDLAGRR